MERDIRRDRGQWRGCYSFKDIICDGDAGSTPPRDGGLKMGHTYYFYYELDGASETHDPALPSTNTCPYLPGQTVNTLWVPVEQSLRKRSASLTSLRDADFKTTNPDDKYLTPRPAAPAMPHQEMMTEAPARRIGSAPSLQRLAHKRSARSLSPGSGWRFSPRKLFSRKASSSSLREVHSPSPEEDERERGAAASSEGSRSRDISPESLRRFLSDDTPLEEMEKPEVNERPSIAIPEDIVEEENEDDDNFAMSAVSETQAYTGLSPPPTSTQRTVSPTPSITLAPPNRPPPAPPLMPLSPPMQQEDWNMQSRFSFSDAGSLYSPSSPLSPEDSSLMVPSFYHSEDEAEEEEALPTIPTRGQMETERRNSFARTLTATLSTYSLPLSSVTIQDGSKLVTTTPATTQPVGSPALVARNGNDVPTGNTSLLVGNGPLRDSGLDDLVSELGWMADVIGRGAKGI
ncbi:hypothetical protein QBC46DRAFT_339646 [Diplogelasinospora grovesii]|uniref:Uncharacterized protein n=1 Tax=Diplogelasinospora grovesii TaxID=303347 RepID=A0AAN6S7A2_9PEZI|nr:hypothetical protein QBC46DRAFT_339646 [Diplogelasinospora grovesii]